jgi:phosphatidylserine/phosphatidylglycerophosphate/cardiolipin synthase-like enzyme
MRFPSSRGLLSFLVIFFSSAALGAGSSKVESCFSPDQECAEKLVKLIDSAKSSIDIAAYDINEDQIVHHLLVQSKRLKVRVVVDRRQSKGKHSAVALLIRAGVAVRYGKQRGIMHNKFVIVDRVQLETGSFNFTHHASRANAENQIYLTDAETVKKYSDRFERLWSGARSY